MSVNGARLNSNVPVRCSRKRKPGVSTHRDENEQ